MLHPSVVQSGLWAVQIIGLIILKDRFIEPASEALFLTVIGSLMFSIGSHCSSNNLGGYGNIMTSRKIRTDNLSWWLIALIIAICLYNQYRIFLELAGGEDFARGLVIVRTLMSIENDEVYGVYKYGYSIAVGALLLLQTFIIKNRPSFFYISMFVFYFFVALFTAILSTGRGNVSYIFVLLGLVYILCGKKNQINRRLFKALGLVSLITFLIFWVMGNLMGKAGDNAIDAISDILDYQFSPLLALSVYLESHPITIFGHEYGSNTFRFFISLLSFIGLHDKPPSLVQEFVNVPQSTNVYTAYFNYIKDFGWLGVTVISFLLGLLHGILFRWSMRDKNNDFALYILAISYMPLLYSLGGEAYFSLLSIWIQYFLIGIFLTQRNKKKSLIKLFGNE